MRFATASASWRPGSSTSTTDPASSRWLFGSPTPSTRTASVCHAGTAAAHSAHETVIADRYDVALSDNAVCHRNLDLGDSQHCAPAKRIPGTGDRFDRRIVLGQAYELVGREVPAAELRELPAGREMLAVPIEARRRGHVGGRPTARRRARVVSPTFSSPGIAALEPLIRERAAMFMKVRALSSEGRMTAVMLR